MPKKKHVIIFLLILCVALIPTNALAANSFSNGKTISMCGWDNMPEIMPKLTSALYAILKLIVPVILIILGMIDFLNATMSPDVDKMKKHQKKFINRLIAAVFIFFVAAIVQMVFRKLDTPDKNTFFTCMDCILSNKNCASAGGSGGTSCESRGISTCTSTVDKNGYKCEIVQTSYSSQTCKRACSEYLAASTCTGQNGRCKWSGSISSGSCSKNPDYTPNNSMNKKTGGGGGSNAKTKDGSTTNNTSTNTSTNTSGGDEVVEYALKFIGHPYVWGGESLCENWPSQVGCGVDCSGFVQHVYMNLGYNGSCIGGTSTEQASLLGAQDYNVLVNLQKGDLLFFYDGLSHVGIYIGNGEYVHASSSKTGVIVSKVANNTPKKWARVIGKCTKS